MEALSPLSKTKATAGETQISQPAAMDAFMLTPRWLMTSCRTKMMAEMQTKMRQCKAFIAAVALPEALTSSWSQGQGQQLPGFKCFGGMPASSAGLLPGSPNLKSSWSHAVFPPSTKSRTRSRYTLQSLCHHQVLQPSLQLNKPSFELVCWATAFSHLSLRAGERRWHVWHQRNE